MTTSDPSRTATWALSWNETDHARSSSGGEGVLRRVFGWVPGRHTCHRYALHAVDARRRTVGGMIVMDDRWPTEVPSHWMVYFDVASIEGSVATVADLGGVVIVPPFPAGPEYAQS